MPRDSTTPHPPGTRVAVRYAMPEPDPVTGARLTDVTGTLVESTNAKVVVDSARGRVEVPRESVVATRIIPPRPSRRGAPHRALSVEDLERVMTGAWPPVERAMLGGWMLRAGHGFTARANSALAVGSPDRPLPAAVDAVAAWYTARALRPQLTVPLPPGVGLATDDVAAAAVAAGWVAGSPVLAQTAATRSVVTGCADATALVEVADTMTDDWYAALARSRAAPRSAAEAVLHGSPTQRFAVLRSGSGAVTAIGRLGVSDGWGGVGAMWVDPDRRGRGLARELLGVLAAEAAALGCVSLHLQVDSANSAAISLYERVGFTTHHTYAYLSL
ncbi:MAG: GNAT family N-acetyltransferase [Dermatophilaceae bacterium]|nr:GNAT family N-acetyltransferase [Intrasporangiaceae bacterium]